MEERITGDCVTSHYLVKDRPIDVRFDRKPLLASATWCSRHDQWISSCSYLWQEKAKALELQVGELQKQLADPTRKVPESWPYGGLSWEKLAKHADEGWRNSANWIGEAKNMERLLHVIRNYVNEEGVSDTAKVIRVQGVVNKTEKPKGENAAGAASQAGLPLEPGAPVAVDVCGNYRDASGIRSVFCSGFESASRIHSPGCQFAVKRNHEKG